MGAGSKNKGPTKKESRLRSAHLINLKIISSMLHSSITLKLIFL